MEGTCRPSSLRDAKSKSKEGGDSRPFLHFFTGPAASCVAPTPAKRDLRAVFFWLSSSAEARNAHPSFLALPVSTPWTKSFGGLCKCETLAFLVPLEALLFVPSRGSESPKVIVLFRLWPPTAALDMAFAMCRWTDGRTSERKDEKGLHFFIFFIYFFFFFFFRARQAARIVSCGLFVSHAF